MADLGTFGVERPAYEEVDTFGYFGETIRVNPAFGELDLADFFDTAARLDGSEGAQAMAALKGVLRDSIHVEDFDRFWAAAKANRQGIEDLMAVLMAVIEAVTARPTQRPSDSSGGPSSTRATSPGGSSSQGIVRDLELAGRPSVAYMVQQREASLASA